MAARIINIPEKSMNYIERYVERIEYFLSHEWNAEARDAARKCLLDYSAVLIAGSRQLAQRHSAYLAAFDGKGSSLIAGMHARADEYTACLLNGMSAHTLELDDGHRYGMLHPSVPVISPLLAILEKENISAENFLRGIAAGYEAMIRLACMIQPNHTKKGFFATATCGTVGAAVGISVAREYPHEQLLAAVSAALTSAAGISEMMTGDSELLPYNAAKAGLNGLVAANIAYCCYKGPEDALGGKKGFIQAFNGSVNDEKFESAIEMSGCLFKVYRKAYASHRQVHPPVEAALFIRKDNGIKPEEIKKVYVSTYDLAVFGHDSSEIHSISAAKMSIPYTVAVALLYGKAGLDAFTQDLVQDEKVQKLARKIKVAVSSELSALVPEKRAALVTVICSDGSEYIRRVDYPKGEPENPLSDDEMYEKVRDLMVYARRSPKEAKKLIDAVSSIDDDISAYLKMLR